MNDMLASVPTQDLLLKRCDCSCGCDTMTRWGICSDCVGGVHAGQSFHGLHCYNTTPDGHMRLTCGWPEKHRLARD